MVFHRSNNSGFTLLEILVVFVIMGILVAMAVPPFLTMIRKQEVRSVTQNLADLINYARTESVRRNTIVFVYPALFKQDGKLNGQATSWAKANGMIAFVDDRSKPENKVARYDKDEVIRSKQVNENSIQLSTYAPIISDNPEEIGLIIYPDGTMRLNKDYRTAQGNSIATVGTSQEYLAIIRANNKSDNSICHVLWVDSLANAKSCPNSVPQNASIEIKKMCSCNTLSLPSPDKGKITTGEYLPTIEDSILPDNGSDGDDRPNYVSSVGDTGMVKPEDNITGSEEVQNNGGSDPAANSAEYTAANNTNPENTVPGPPPPKDPSKVTPPRFSCYVKKRAKNGTRLSLDGSTKLTVDYHQNPPICYIEYSSSDVLQQYTKLSLNSPKVKLEDLSNNNYNTTIWVLDDNKTVRDVELIRNNSNRPSRYTTCFVSGQAPCATNDKSH